MPLPRYLFKQSLTQHGTQPIIEALPLVILALPPLPMNLKDFKMTFSKRYITPIKLKPSDMKSTAGRIKLAKYLKDFAHAENTILEYNKAVNGYEKSSKVFDGYLEGFAIEINNMLSFLAYDEKELYKYSDFKIRTFDNEKPVI